MRGFRTVQRAAALKEYNRQLKQIDGMIPVVDVAKRAAEFWNDLVGAEIEAGSSSGHAYLYVHMGQLMPNGQYPSKSIHLQQLIEFIDDQLKGIIDFDKFEQDADEYQQTLRFGQYGKLLVIYAYNGGNCTYEKVGEETVTKDIFETRCT